MQRYGVEEREKYGKMERERDEERERERVNESILSSQLNREKTERES
jgi:hypothetical protein